MLVTKLLVITLFSGVIGLDQQRRRPSVRAPGNQARRPRPSNNAQYPSIVFLLTETGVNNLRASFTELIALALPRVPLDDVGEVPIGKTYAYVGDRKFTGLGKDNVMDVYLLPPNKVYLNIEHASLVLEMAVTFYSGRGGTATAEVTSIQGQLETAINANAEGQIQLDVTGCDLSVGRIKLVYKSHSGKVTIIHPRVMERRMEANVNEVICQELQKSLWRFGNSLNAIFRDQPLLDPNATMPMSQSFISEVLGIIQPAGVRAATRKASRIFYRSRLAAAPTFTSQPETIMLPFNAKICSDSRCRMDIPQHPVPTIVRVPNKMANVYVSDYLMNTFLLSLYDSGLLNMSYGNSNSGGMKGFFRQTCAQSICLGDLLPSWIKAYPGEMGEVKVALNQPPEFKFKPNKIEFFNDAFLSFFSKGKRGPSRLILSADVKALLSVKLHVSLRSKVYGKVTMEKWDFNVRQNHIRAAASEIKMLNDNVKQLILNRVQKFMSNGYQLNLPYMQISDLELSPLDGVIFFAFNYVSDPERLINTFWPKTQ